MNATNIMVEQSGTRIVASWIVSNNGDRFKTKKSSHFKSKEEISEKEKELLKMYDNVEPQF